MEGLGEPHQKCGLYRQRGALSLQMQGGTVDYLMYDDLEGAYSWPVGRRKRVKKALKIVVCLTCDLEALLEEARVM